MALTGEVRRRTLRRKEAYTSFSCWVYKNYGKARCTSHAISYNALSQLVLEDIRRNAIVAKKYTDIEKLDAHILNELIDRIVVHEKELGPDGLKHQRVDIHYKFIGYVDIEEEWNKDETAQLLRKVFEDMTATA